MRTPGQRAFTPVVTPREPSASGAMAESLCARITVSGPGHSVSDHAPIAAVAQESRQAIFFISFILLHPFVNFDLQLYHSPASLVGTDPELLPFPCGDRP